MSIKDYILRKDTSEKYFKIAENTDTTSKNTFLEACGEAVEQKDVGYLTLYYPYKTLMTESVTESGTTYFDFTIDTDNDTFEGVLKDSALEKVNSRIGVQYGQARPLQVNGAVNRITLEITGKNHKLEEVTDTVTSNIYGANHVVSSPTQNFYKEITSIKVSGSFAEGEQVSLEFNSQMKVDNIDYIYLKNNTINNVKYIYEIRNAPTNLSITVNGSSPSNENSNISFSSDIGTSGRQFDNTILPIAVIEFMKK